MHIAHILMCASWMSGKTVFVNSKWQTRDEHFSSSSNNNMYWKSRQRKTTIWNEKKGKERKQNGKGFKIHFAFGCAIFNVSIVFNDEHGCTAGTRTHTSFFNFFWTRKSHINRVLYWCDDMTACIYAYNISIVIFTYTHIHMDDMNNVLYCPKKSEKRRKK